MRKHMSPLVKVKPSPLHGKGVFATQNISKGEVIVEREPKLIAQQIQDIFKKDYKEMIIKAKNELNWSTEKEKLKTKKKKSSITFFKVNLGFVKIIICADSLNLNK